MPEGSQAPQQPAHCCLMMGGMDHRAAETGELAEVGMWIVRMERCCPLLTIGGGFPVFGLGYFDPRHEGNA